MKQNNTALNLITNYGKKTMSEEEIVNLIKGINKKDLMAMYYSALVVISEDNDITIEEANAGIQIMIANVEMPIIPTETSMELH